MYVGMIASSSEDIDAYYVSIAASVAKFLANNEYNLIFGGSSKSMLGACYREFSNKDREIIALTTEKYQDDLANLPKAHSIVCETTFDMKKEFFENSDVIVVLPGGLGTFSELFAFLEENRSNDREVPIEIYDEANSGYYLPFIEQLQMMVVSGFADSSILSSFKISHNKEEFMEHLDGYNRKGGYYGK